MAIRVPACGNSKIAERIFMKCDIGVRALLKCFDIQSVPKKMYTYKVNIPYYNVYTSFWDTCIVVWVKIGP
jgi:hypothetical protein